MNKIPVWKTIRFAYAFTFGEIGTIIGLIWLPTLLIAVLQFLPYALGTQVVDQEPAAAVAASAFANLAFFAAALLLYAMNAAAVIRQALGLRQGGATIHFSVGLQELRVFGAFAMCGLLFVGCYLVLQIGLSLLAGILPVPGQSLFLLGWMCVVIYLALRLGALLVPVVVAEEKIDLRRVWSLSSGNYWRIQIVALAVFVPLFLLQFVGTVAIAGVGILAPLPLTQDAMQAAVNARVALLDKHLPELMGLSLILAPFSIGLTFGAAAAAYRAIVPRSGRRV